MATSSPQEPLRPNAKPRVLLAARPVARQPFREAIGADAELVEVETLEEALKQLKNRDEPQIVCCTVYFDESRMFELLRWVRAERAHIPVICARAVPKDITKVSMEAVKIAVDALGAASFIDVAAIMERYGPEAAIRKLRELLLNVLAAPS
jgi:PleD family two-component response regulator